MMYAKSINKFSTFNPSLHRIILFSLFFVFSFYFAKSSEMHDLNPTSVVSNIFSQTLIKSENVHYAIIPGITGVGGEHLREVLAIHPHSDDHITYAKTPLQYGPIPFMTNADFGQKECQRLLHEYFDPLFEREDIHKIIFHASSQGTSSILNYFNWVKKSDNERATKWESKIGALVLESAMLSGNSAIHHCVTNTFRWGNFHYGNYLGKIPFSYYWMPYVAKFKFPFYSPGGNQAVDSLEIFPDNIPIIIFHSESDKVLSYEAALVVYTKLKKINPSVYFLKSNRRTHINLLKRAPSRGDVLSHEASTEINQNIAALNSIWKNHGLPHSTDLAEKSEKLSEFSITIDQNIINDYDRRNSIEKKIHRVLCLVTVPLSMFAFSHFLQ